MADNSKPLFGFQPNAGSSANASPFGAAAAGSTTQQKPLFGGGSGTTLFGGASGTSQAPSSGSLFGSTAAASPAPSSGTTLFGSATPTANTPAISTSLFGKAGTTTPATSAPSLFGNTAPTSGGFSFGPKATAPASTPSLFGTAGATTSAAPSTSTSAAPSVFGDVPTAMPDKNSVFANGAKMPQSGTGGLFQNLGKADTSTPQAKPASALSFTPAGKPPTSTGGSGTGLFGQASQATSAAPATSGLFGAKPDETKTPSFSLGQNTGGKSLFGEVKPASDKPSTGLFGAAAPTTQAPASSSSSSLFGNILNKKDDKAPTSSSAAAPSLFGATTTGASAAPSLFGTATSSAPTATPSLFSATTTSSQPASTTATSGGLFGSAQPAAGTAASTSAPSAGLFGSAPTTAASSGIAAPSTTATTAAPLGGLFGGATSNTTTTSAPAASGQPAAAPPAATGTLFGASVGNPSATASTNQQPSSRLASKSLDEIITTWSSSLAAHQKTFANVSERVAKWDRQLVQNSSAIGGLYARVFQAERDTSEVERQLSNVEAGQRELDARLQHYEAEVDRLLNAAGLGEDSTANGVDNEREQTYNAAEDCQSRLTDMGQNLTAMIEEINLASNKLSTTKKSNSNSEDPLAQIVRVLNSHLAQLQAIDKGAQALTIKVEQAQKDAGQLASRNGVSGHKEWIEGFGRSYLGRR